MAPADREPLGGQPGQPRPVVPQARPVAGAPAARPGSSQPASAKPVPRAVPAGGGPAAAQVPTAIPTAAPVRPARPAAAPAIKPTVAPATQPTVARPVAAPGARGVPRAIPAAGAPARVAPSGVVPSASPVGVTPVARPVAQPVAGGVRAVAGVRPVAVAGAARTQAEAKEDEENEKQDLAEVAAKSAPPWLVSLAVHMVILIALGLWFLPSIVKNQVFLDVATEDVEIGEQIDDVPLNFGDAEETAEEVITPENLPEVDDPFAAPPDLPIDPLGAVVTSKISAPMIGSALDGRSVGSKKKLLGKYGGNGNTEGAVSLGLAWLARQQKPDGSWSLRGPYSDGGVENVAAATAMALLAFQGAGNTHQEGKYKANVDRGMKALLKMQDGAGNFFHDGPPHNHPYYTQGQCSIAVCELYAMTKDPKLKDPAQRAIQFCIDSQDKGLGGWRYHARMDSDTSVTGWIVMALQSALMGGLEVPAETFQLINQYLDQAQTENGARYGYQPGIPPNEAMTAEGLLCRQYLGWKQDDERLGRGADFLVQPQNLPNWGNRNVYYWYYATQVLHHLEGERWETWNNVMKELLPSKQEKRGAEAGSWSPNGGPGNFDEWGAKGGGRLFVTCLSIYILEVYYRHMPLYSGDFAPTPAGAAPPVTAATPPSGESPEADLQASKPDDDTEAGDDAAGADAGDATAPLEGKPPAAEAPGADMPERPAAPLNPTAPANPTAPPKPDDPATPAPANPDPPPVDAPSRPKPIPGLDP